MPGKTGVNYGLLIVFMTDIGLKLLILKEHLPGLEMRII